MPQIECQSSLATQRKAKTVFSERDVYESQLLKAQIQLLSLQQKIFRQKQKVIVVLEGSDTAGKGGLVRRMAQHLDPRTFHVYGIGPPTADERTQHYLQRFFARLPQAGELCVFDRSWYGRVLVERVEKLATPTQWRRAYNEINSFEKMLSDDGVLILKYLLDLSYTEQGRRFKARENDPLKSWKMTPDDYRNRKNWDPYQVAFREMRKRTSTPMNPWGVVPADSKWFTRIHILNDISKRAGEFFG
jgi:polyphosphate kinase 2 (PPK2 family)